MEKKIKILIPLFYDYYIFDYLLPLTKRLVNDGFDVTVITYDQRVIDKYNLSAANFHLQQAPRLLRLLMNRNKWTLAIVLLYCFGQVWVRYLKRQFDFAIIPWETKLIWHLIAKHIPALVCHSTTLFSNIDAQLDEHLLSDVYAKTIRHRLALSLDRVFRGNFLPRLQENIVTYNKVDIVLFLLGIRPQSLDVGFGPALYDSVCGHQVANNFQQCIGSELNNKKKFIVLGNPSYEGLMDFTEKFPTSARCRYRQSLDIEIEKKVFSFFLSPSTLTDDQIREIKLAVDMIQTFYSDAFFIIKFHPKIDAKSPPRLRQALALPNSDFRFIHGYTGDEENAKLVLISDCLVQKQSTVGYLAMLYRVPIISYNLVATHYVDNMYKYLDGSWHAESTEDFAQALIKLADPESQQQLIQKQKRACHNFCIQTPSPCANISNLIKQHFGLLG